MKGKVNLYLLLLIVILTFGFLLRVYKLPEIPSGFFADEASIGYNAYTTLTKGMDEYGAKYPLFFRAFGEYKNPIQIYATVPFIALFGLNEFSVRFTSAIFGTLTIIAIYFLTKKLLTKTVAKQSANKMIALFAALFLAISPWHIHFSRTSLEGQTAFVFFTILGLYCFLKSQKNKKLLFLSTITFVLAIYSYFPARIFIPIFGFSILVLYIKFFLQNKKLTLLNFILLVFLLTPLIQHSLSPSGFSRWNQVNIFSQKLKDETIYKHILNNYLSHFSLDFLFLKGDIDMSGQFITRHSVRGMGELYLLQLPIVILGFLPLIKRKEARILLIFALWFILYPIGSMFTLDKSAQSTRSIIGVVPFQIISALGLCYTLSLLSKTKKFIYYAFIIIVAVAFSFFVFNYLKLYFVKYPLYSSDYWGWQYGYRSILEEFKNQEGKYDQLLITHRYNSGEMLLKFYNITFNCKKCMAMTNPISINSDKKQLFALRRHDIVEAKTLYNDLQFIQQEVIYLPNGNAEIFIGKFVKQQTVGKDKEIN